MIKPGESQELRVVKMVTFGVYLADEEDTQKAGEIREPDRWQEGEQKGGPGRQSYRDGSSSETGGTGGNADR